MWLDGFGMRSMSETWADGLTLFQALDIVGEVQKAVERGQYGRVAELLQVPADWTGSPDEFNDMVNVRFAALADRITNEGGK